MKIKKILVANRGEIAVRVLRTCRELGIRTVAVYSDPDRNSLHVSLADEAYSLGGSKPAESYLNQEKLLNIVKQSGAQAVHPGYGFLSENPSFAQMLEDSGIVFIGPTSAAIRALGDKTAARKVAQSLGVPTVAGTTEALRSDEESFRIARQIGYPILLKAAAGGGGKGMRMVEDEQHLQSSLEAARSEALSAFGDSRVYIEKYIKAPRHIEVQILADRFGNVVYLGERECSIQRRHQKIIEETPSPVVDEDLRKRLGESAIRIALAAHYVNAGTLEFLVDAERNFYFLEMNTRLQVEHPVTEMVTGLDLVREQIAIAEGEPLHFRQTDISPRGHAIECRICAEDPAHDFFPSTGTLLRYKPPQGRIRVDNGYNEGDTISVFYDSLMSKVISYGTTRCEAISAMKRALSEFEVEGVETTIPFCQFVLDHPAFQSGAIDTTFIQRYFTPSSLQLHTEEENVVAAIFGAFLATSSRLSSPSSNGVRASGTKSNWKLQRREGMQGW